MGMEPIIEVLPEGWREKARELNAFRRAGDYLKTPEDLLRVALLWADLGTFGHTASFLKMTGNFPMSKAALYQRVAKSAAWLEWLAVSFRRERKYLTEPPEWFKGYRVTAADATKAMGKELYTLHMMIELFSLNAKAYERLAERLPQNGNG